MLWIIDIHTLGSVKEILNHFYGGVNEILNILKVEITKSTIQ